MENAVKAVENLKQKLDKMFPLAGDKKMDLAKLSARMETLQGMLKESPPTNTVMGLGPSPLLTELKEILEVYRDIVVPIMVQQEKAKLDAIISIAKNSGVA